MALVQIKRAHNQLKMFKQHTKTSLEHTTHTHKVYSIKSYIMIVQLKIKLQKFN